MTYAHHHGRFRHGLGAQRGRWKVPLQLFFVELWWLIRSYCMYLFELVSRDGQTLSSHVQKVFQRCSHRWTGFLHQKHVVGAIFDRTSREVFEAFLKDDNIRILLVGGEVHVLVVCFEMVD